MKIALVKYNAGNVQSVLFALRRLGHTAEWTDDPATLRRADRVIFPGVGEASSAMHYLKARGLDELIRSLQQPVLGICLGLQLFCRHSEENDTPCLRIFECDVRRFGGLGMPAKPGGPRAVLKVPHMGWNKLHQLQGPLFSGVAEESYVYFVHSYYAEMQTGAIAQTEYGEIFSAALQRDNFFAVQFHPEKSGPVGQQILKNFLNI